MYIYFTVAMYLKPCTLSRDDLDISTTAFLDGHVPTCSCVSCDCYNDLVRLEMVLPEARLTLAAKSVEDRRSDIAGDDFDSILERMAEFTPQNVGFDVLHSPVDLQSNCSIQRKI